MRTTDIGQVWRLNNRAQNLEEELEDLDDKTSFDIYFKNRGHEKIKPEDADYEEFVKLLKARFEKRLKEVVTELESYGVEYVDRKTYLREQSKDADLS